MRYVALVLLNLPIILMAFLNLFTRYKLNRISKEKFKVQTLIWIVVLIVLILSFPAYNFISGRPPLDSHELSLFDITQTTVIILLFYIVNNLRQKLDKTEKTLRDLHSSASILFSKDSKK